MWSKSSQGTMFEPTVPWDLQRMDSTFGFNQIPSRGHDQDHTVFIPKIEKQITACGSY